MRWSEDPLAQSGQDNDNHEKRFSDFSQLNDKIVI
jgi:hypothetical protein